MNRITLAIGTTIYIVRHENNNAKLLQCKILNEPDNSPGMYHETILQADGETINIYSTLLIYHLDSYSPTASQEAYNIRGNDMKTYIAFTNFNEAKIFFISLLDGFRNRAANEADKAHKVYFSLVQQVGEWESEIKEAESVTQK
jgi:hypothetical protein